MVSRLPCWSFIHEQSHSAVGRGDGRRPAQCRKGLTVFGVVWCNAEWGQGSSESGKKSELLRRAREAACPGLSGDSRARAGRQPCRGTWGCFLCAKVQEMWESRRKEDFLNREDWKGQVRVLNIDGQWFKCWGLGASCWAQVSHWPVPYQQTRRRAWGRSAAAPGSAVTGDERHLPSKQNTPLLCRACSPRPRFRNPQLSCPAT